MSYIKESREKAAASLEKAFTRRNMKFYYCPTIEEAKAQVLSMIPEGSSVSWGGSESMEEAGIIQAVREGSYDAIDRKSAKTPEESRALYGKIVCCDYFSHQHQRLHKGRRAYQYRRRRKPCGMYQPWSGQCDRSGEHG